MIHPAIEASFKNDGIINPITLPAATTMKTWSIILEFTKSVSFPGPTKLTLVFSKLHQHTQIERKSTIDRRLGEDIRKACYKYHKPRSPSQINVHIIEFGIGGLLRIVHGGGREIDAHNLGGLLGWLNDVRLLLHCTSGTEPPADCLSALCEFGCPSRNSRVS